MPALYAHRLGRAYGPDSSRAALAGALRGPLDGLETDCCLTADGRVVLLHDPLLDLCSTLSGWAYRRPAAEIANARLLDAAGAPSDERPLLLEELLELAPAGMTLQLEVKAHADAALARRTARAVCDRVQGRPEVEIISFWPGACEIAAACGLPTRLVVIAGYEMGALAEWGRRVGVDGVCIEHFLLTAELMGTLRAAGLSVTTGTINDAQLLGPALSLGVDAITSDRPHALRPFLPAGEPLALAA